MEKNINKGNPWKGLSSYTYQDAGCFYGRDQELKDIFSVIKQNAFTTLYGISGAGKTSIINAGLFPLLDKQAFLPIYIRLDHSVGHIPYDLQIINAVGNALTSVDAESEDIVGYKVDSELDNLWLYFHSHKFWSKDNHITTPIIFIDQFEEIFTKNDDVDKIWEFFNIIDSLQYSTPTERILKIMEDSDQFFSFGEEQNFRMVFSMREDFLARLEDYSYNIPALRKNRIGLKPLNGLQALDVILKPRPDMVTRKVALHIISKVVGNSIVDNERKLETTSVDTSILSLFCTELYNYAISDNKGEISIPLVDLYGGNILEWFYDRNMQNLPKQTYVYLENQLLTHSGYRNSVALDNLLEKGILQEQLDLLAESRIVRIEDVNHNLRVEFTHDVLCRIAKKRRDERNEIEKMKSEKAARRAFTIDNVILFSVFTFGLLAIYYGGLLDSVFLYFISLPFIAFIYVILTNRSVADKNLSNIIWFIIICCVTEVGIAFLFMYFQDVLALEGKSRWFFNSLFFSFMSFIPIGIVLMPFALLIKVELHNRFYFLKSIRKSIITYALFLLGQSLLLFLWSFLYLQYKDDNDSYHMLYISYFFAPSIIMACSPAYMLWKNVKQKTSMTLSGLTFIYTLYILFVSLMIWAKSENHIILETGTYVSAYRIGFFVIWLGCGTLCIFYAIQYMKLPQKQSFTNYYKNALNFQAFTKYKSFKSRLYTIIIFFAIFLMGIVATLYLDIVPFFTLPLACLLALHVGCSEFKLTTPKTVFSYKVICPIVVLSEIIVGCQYITGSIKIYAIFISALLLSFFVFGHLVFKEIIRTRKLFALRILFFSVFIGFMLPVLCLGYNIFNISLNPVCRVWGGTIFSNVRRICFMKIEDVKGNVGVMDYSEIIVAPKYKNISYSCTINKNMVESVYPLRYMLMNLLEIKVGKDDYFDEDENKEKLLSFYVENYDGRKDTISDLYFLKFENKYGINYVNRWLKEFKGEPMSILSPDNKCISEKDRDATIVKLFVRELANTCGDKENITFHYNVGIGKIPGYAVDDVDDFTKLLVRCYNEASLEPLVKDNEISLTIEKLEEASMKVDYLFVFDKKGKLEKAILEKLWDKWNDKNGIPNSISNENRSFLYLLSGNKARAEQIAKACVSTNPNSLNASCNLCLSLYYNRKYSEMDEELKKFETTNLNNAVSIVSYYDMMSSKISRLTKLGILKSDNELISHIVSLFKWDIDKIENQRVDLEESGEVLNRMAYDYSNASNFILAIKCIEKAIKLYPKEANYYESKGEILLKQGNNDSALEMWNEVIRIDPNFLDNHNSELHRQLYERGLLSD